MDEQKSLCVQQDFVPFGAAALLHLIQIHNHAKQGNGYRILPLGDLFFISFFTRGIILKVDVSKAANLR